MEYNTTLSVGNVSYGRSGRSGRHTVIFNSCTSQNNVYPRLFEIYLKTDTFTIYETIIQFTSPHHCIFIYFQKTQNEDNIPDN